MASDKQWLEQLASELTQPATRVRQLAQLRETLTRELWVREDEDLKGSVTVTDRRGPEDLIGISASATFFPGPRVRSKNRTFKGPNAEKQALAWIEKESRKQE